ncbi:unnamed protein product [Laminaria digitata]
MAAAEKQNANPTVYSSGVARKNQAIPLQGAASATSRDAIDAEEVFDLIRHVNDPEHPLTLEQLKVVSPEAVVVDDGESFVQIQFTPTIPHCSMATLIGLCLRVKLLRSLPARFKVVVRIAPGTHSSEDAVNKQLGDKERVAAALENSHLMAVVNKCIKPQEPS